MKLVPVPFGNKTGRSMTLRNYCGGLTIGNVYQILDHRMDEGTFSSAQYFLVANDSGTNQWVPSTLFSGW